MDRSAGKVSELTIFWAICAIYKVRSDRAATIVTGVSMGGYGSLKIAFHRPDRFAAVAAMERAVEPAIRGTDLGARNRFSFPKTDSAQALVGENRDPTVFEGNNPASRAIANAAAIRESGLAVYLEVGDEDVLNLHDGTEFLHRVLLDLASRMCIISFDGPITRAPVSSPDRVRRCAGWAQF